MPVILAENIDGWLMAGLCILGGWGSAVLALIGLIPAFKANRPATLGMIAPAPIMVLLITGWLLKGYYSVPSHDAEDIRLDYVQPWLFMALPPLVASILTGSVLWYKVRNRRQV